MNGAQRYTIDMKVISHEMIRTKPHIIMSDMRTPI